MVGPIEQFTTADHVRLDTLLQRAERPDGTVDAGSTPISPRATASLSRSGDAAEAEAIVARLRAQPAVPVAKHYDGPLLHRR